MTVPFIQSIGSPQVSRPHGKDAQRLFNDFRCYSEYKAGYKLDKGSEKQINSSVQYFRNLTRTEAKDVYQTVNELCYDIHGGYKISTTNDGDYLIKVNKQKNKERKFYIDKDGKDIPELPKISVKKVFQDTLRALREALILKDYGIQPYFDEDNCKFVFGVPGAKETQCIDHNGTRKVKVETNMDIVA